ncbi:MAG TPA: hypothetical protein PKB07_20840, partial [Flavilitoribacter sp.]|nr:hypothetical protein [Flavilitoribacter sp.]
MPSALMAAFKKRWTMKNSSLLFAFLILTAFGNLGKISAQSCGLIISGQGSYNVCCTGPISYTVISFAGCSLTNASFDWSVSGGTIAFNSGTGMISVNPSVGSTVTVTCKVTIGNGQPVTVIAQTVWYGSQTPPISAPDYFCKNEIYTICVPATCGMTGVDWTLPPNLDLVSTVSPFCIRVMPSLNAPVGSSGVITAQAITTTGCTLSASNPLSFKIYEAETPPAPSGYITLDLDSGDPCDDPVYVVNFHAPHPYRNGITTVSPGIILGGN